MSSNSQNIKVSGMMKCPNDLEANVIEVSGMMKVEGKIIANELNGDGMVKVADDIRVPTIEINGVLKSGNKIYSETMKVYGALNANSIDAEELTIAGKITISKDINCEKMALEIDGNSSVENIEGTMLKVTSKKNRQHLDVDTITADDINVEHVNCNTIHGDRVIIGRNCEVKHVTYKSSLEVHPSSKVKTSEKV